MTFNASMSFKNVLVLLLIQIAIGNLYSQNYHLKNAVFWNGTKMVAQDLFIENSKITFNKPIQIDSIIDLRGKYITPAFGDFHTHLFDGKYSKSIDTLFRSKGIFFANDLVNNPLGRDKMKSYFDKVKTVDVAYANGCLTSSNGHPIRAYEKAQFDFGQNYTLTKAQREQIAKSRKMENLTYYIIDSLPMVSEKLNRLNSTNPDFIKVIISNSERYIISDTLVKDNLGLDPRLLPKIVKEAEAANKTVVAHVESEFDLIAAIQAGITYFAHLPNHSYGIDAKAAIPLPLLSTSTLLLMKMNEVKINPTLYRTQVNISYTPKAYQPDATVLASIKSFHRSSLEFLKKYQIEILAGADIGYSTAVDEILYYNTLAVFEPSQLLNILINTSRHIFPERKIGAIKEGYEANLLVLGANPTMDITAITQIDLLIKQGVVLP